MKKIILSLILLVVLVATIFIFTACSSNVPVPGVSWASTEILKYDIKDSANKNAKIGTFETSIEKLTAGDYTIDKIPNKTFKISTNVLKGFRYKEIAKDINDNIIMETESIFDAFDVVASYKKIHDNSLDITPYETIIYLDNGKYKININGEAKSDIKAKDNVAPNEILYNLVRAYSELSTEDAFSKTLSVIDPTTGRLIDLSLTAKSERTKIKFSFSSNEKELEVTEQECIQVEITKNTAPIGKSINIWYTPNDFQIKGSLNSSSSNYSIHVPVKIVEDRLVYVLTEAYAV
ncbi:MAG: hypothetical protein LBF68_06010 [Christensenellaceae bacterium]|jgi:hypothetical protein|nr:hypothetical protein [Christensenellaceae bacterium]